MIPKLAAAAMALLSTLLAASAWAIDVQRVTSPGGIRAWLVEDRSAPIVSLSFSFAGGSGLDAPGKEGTGAMLAGLLDQGAGDMDSRAFNARRDDLSVRLGFSASLDRFSGSMRALAINREASFDLLRAALLQPRLAPESIDLLRSQMLADLRQAAQTPGAVANRTLQEDMFRGHPYARPPSGTLASVEGLKVEDLQAFARRQFVRDGLIVAVVGDITPAELGRLLDRAFGALPASADTPAAPTPPWRPAAGGRTVVKELPAPQSAILVALPGLLRSDPDWEAMAVLNRILGGAGLNSRLSMEVREKRGLSYGIGSGMRTWRQAGLFMVQTSTQNPKAGETLGIVRAEIEKMAKDGPTAAEIDDAKTYLVGSLALTLDSTGAVAGLLHSLQVDGLGPEEIDRRAELIGKVSADDVRRVASRLLKVDQATTVVVGRPVGVTATP
jgi:zinc protease